MMWTAFVAVLAASCLPAHGISLWKNDTDYIHFTIMKSCFGEEVAVQLETFAYSVGQYCEETEGTGQSSLPDGSSGSRRRRSLLKLPENPPISQILCNLGQMRLLTKESEVDYFMVEDLLRRTAIDDGLKYEMMEVLTYCRNQQVPLPDLLPGNPYNEVIKAVLSLENYFNCIIPEGIRTCKLHEMTRYFEELL